LTTGAAEAHLFPTAGRALRNGPATSDPLLPEALDRLFNSTSWGASRMSTWTTLRTPTEKELVVGIYDLTQYTIFSERTSPLRLLEMMAGYHALIAGIIEDAGGVFIKPIGDAGLFAFFAEDADTAVHAVYRCFDEGDAWLQREGYPGRPRFGLHAGPVAIGRIGPKGREWLDIIGKTVNIAARVRSYTLSITPAVFRLLPAEARKKFRKHTPPMSYIRESDPRPRDYHSGFEESVVR